MSSNNAASHIALLRHADFIECACGHLAVTDSDFMQHTDHMARKREQDAREEAAYNTACGDEFTQQYADEMGY